MFIIYRAPGIDKRIDISSICNWLINERTTILLSQVTARMANVVYLDDRQASVELFVETLSIRQSRAWTSDEAFSPMLDLDNDSAEFLYSPSREQVVEVAKMRWLIKQTNKQMGC